MTGLADIAEMDRGALVALWSASFGTAPPSGMSQGLMRRFLADAIQARRQGGVPASIARAYDRIATGTDKRTTRGLRPGGRLIREWNGTSHVVEVTDGGYLWQGRRFRSLSAIARAITGAHWSGPRFFGLTNTPGTTSPKPAHSRPGGAMRGRPRNGGPSKPFPPGAGRADGAGTS